MTDTWFYSLISVLFVGVISLAGAVAIVLSRRTVEQFILITVSLACGAMFGDAFIHILPEAFLRSGKPLSVSSAILMGILSFFVLEKFLRWRHSHDFGVGTGNAVKPVGYLNLLADGVHNFIDGLLIGTAYLAGIPVGVATTIAIVLHEIPQELGDFGVLIHAGFTTRRVLLFNFLTGLTALAGTVLSLLTSRFVTGFSDFMLPFTAGSFLYIAGCDLLPELHKESHPAKSLLQLAAMLLGMALMYVLVIVG
jgi:zinc and cadmium transporter